MKLENKNRWACALERFALPSDEVPVGIHAPIHLLAPYANFSASCAALFFCWRDRDLRSTTANFSASCAPAPGAHDVPPAHFPRAAAVNYFLIINGSPPDHLRYMLVLANEMFNSPHAAQGPEDDLSPTTLPIQAIYGCGVLVGSEAGHLGADATHAHTHLDLEIPQRKI